MTRRYADLHEHLAGDSRDREFADAERLERDGHLVGVQRDSRRGGGVQAQQVRFPAALADLTLMLGDRTGFQT